MLMAALRRLDAERAHGLSLAALRWGLVPRAAASDYANLAVPACGRVLRNPIGLAAGFDKNAAALNGLGRLGFGFLEAGTVTPRPQPGNAKPRLFRLTEDAAVINRMGFNNAGLDVFLANLRAARRDRVAVGANVGVNKDGAVPERDYRQLIDAVAPLADYVTINISSPNTPGLRDLQAPERLGGILAAVGPRAHLFVKLAPDLAPEALADIVAVCRQYGVAGLIAANTTIARPDSLRSAHRAQTGGLSGRPLMAPSTAMLARLFRLVGRDLPLIGAGGVFTAEDALAKILAGASLVQLYTGFAYHGPGLIPRLTAGLSRLLEARGFATVADAVGAA
jgi:dihydroorotate dehydrogenase